MRSIPRFTLPFALLLSLGAQAAPDKMQAVEVGEGGRLSVQTRPVPRPGRGRGTHQGARGRRESGRLESGHASPRHGAGHRCLRRHRHAGRRCHRLESRRSGARVRAPERQLRRVRRHPGRRPGAQAAVHDVREAAGVPIAAETAYRALHEAGKIARGQTVLIHGAAGGVGSAAVQIAKAAGARVIGTASPNNHEFLRVPRRRPGHRLSQPEVRRRGAGTWTWC